MIYDTLENLALYEKALPTLSYLKEVLSKPLEVGRYELNDGNYFVVSMYEPEPFSGTYEFHKKYIDVQLLLEGEEKIKVAPLKDTTFTKDYDESIDAGFSTCDKASELLLKKGVFAVFFPEDAHAPGIKADCDNVKKVVLKLKV